MASDLAKPITLKCGLNLPNRLMKAAMAEVMADRDYYPGELFQRAYGKWAEGGWGMVLLGTRAAAKAFRRAIQLTGTAYRKRTGG